MDYFLHLRQHKVCGGGGGGVSAPLGTGEGCRHIKTAMDLHKVVGISSVSAGPFSELRCSVSWNEGISVLTLPKIPLSQLLCQITVPAEEKNRSHTENLLNTFLEAVSFICPASHQFRTPGSTPWGNRGT